MQTTAKDIFAPASFITGLGLILCIYGAVRLNEPLGLWLILIGRSMDLIDGPVSRATRPSRFGAAFDATADKIALAAILIASFVYELAPITALFYITLHNIFNAVFSSIAQAKGNEPTAAISGKLAMFSENIALLLFIMSSLGIAGGDTEIVAWVALIGGLPLGVLASAKYLHSAITKQPKTTTRDQA